MKKNLLLTALLFFTITSTTLAQSKLAFNNGDNLLNVGVGLGSPFFGTGYSSSLPFNPTVSFEHGISDAISIGAMVSYADSKYGFAVPGEAYSFKESATFLGVRGSYHFDQLLELPEKFDLYAGASLGYVAVGFSDNQGYTGSVGSAVGLGVFGGAKYYLGSNVSGYGELGFQSLSVLNLGLTFKF